MQLLDPDASTAVGQNPTIPGQRIAAPDNTTDTVGAPPTPLRVVGPGPSTSLLPGKAARAPAKRLLDVTAASAGLVALSPVLAVVGAAVRLTSPGPAVYRQQRIGLCGRPFTIWKFRTMQNGADEQLNDLLSTVQGAAQPLFKISNDPRVTPLGRWLRRTSLDELPQLVNVLRGEMSLVGPRPQRTAEVDLYEDWHYERLTVRPGVTGAWQVNGRSDLDWPTAVALDLDYIRTWSMWSDAKILARTLRVVISGHGAY